MKFACVLLFSAVASVWANPSSLKDNCVKHQAMHDRDNNDGSPPAINIMGKDVKKSSETGALIKFKEDISGGLKKTCTYNVKFEPQGGHEYALALGNKNKDGKVSEGGQHKFVASNKVYCNSLVYGGGASTDFVQLTIGQYDDLFIRVLHGTYDAGVVTFSATYNTTAAPAKLEDCFAAPATAAPSGTGATGGKSMSAGHAVVPSALAPLALLVLEAARRVI